VSGAPCRVGARPSGGSRRRGPLNLAAVPRRVGLAACLLWGAACHGAERAPAAAVKENDVPVAINSESPFQYPPALYNQGIEGEVRLRLFVDATGRVIPESTRVAGSSGTPGLDSAAVRGAARLQFAPAHRDGQPVGMAFYQPVIFRRASEAAAGPPP
jgi:TonB family protein